MYMFISGHCHLLGMRKTEVYFLCCYWKVRVTSAQSFTLWQKATTEITRRDHSIIACLHHIYMGAALCTHPIRGESHIQSNTNWEVATISPLFAMIRTDRTFFLWRLHQARPVTLVTAPFFCNRKARAASAQSFTLWQQATIQITQCNHYIIACPRHIYMGFVFHLHPIRGETHVQHNTNREIATHATKLCETCGNDWELKGQVKYKLLSQKLRYI